MASAFRAEGSPSWSRLLPFALRASRPTGPSARRARGRAIPHGVMAIVLADSGVAIGIEGELLAQTTFDILYDLATDTWWLVDEYMQACRAHSRRRRCIIWPALASMTSHGRRAQGSPTLFELLHVVGHVGVFGLVVACPPRRGLGPTTATTRRGAMVLRGHRRRLRGCRRGLRSSLAPSSKHR